jgi:hypothetical protein
LSCSQRAAVVAADARPSRTLTTTTRSSSSKRT